MERGRRAWRARGRRLVVALVLGGVVAAGAVVFRPGDPCELYRRTLERAERTREPARTEEIYRQLGHLEDDCAQHRH